jgi:hypothetical protein
MSIAYANYLREHTQDVARAYEWLRENLPDILIGEDCTMMMQIGHQHDLSKLDPEEYEAYDLYFYGKEKTDEVKKNFNYAWLHHIHNNPHHWQYWVLINDDPNKGETILDMPHNYIIEMVCDWWSFSWKKGNLHEIFSWYEERKSHIKLSDKTRATVEDILNKIREKLDEDGFINTPIMSYAVKFASAFYGPFRDAADSAPHFGDRKSYQMDYHNGREAMKEALLDVEEGTDFLIVKPAMAFYDLLERVVSATNIPIATYSVSGEYSMVKAAAQNGWIDEERIIGEMAVGAYRAGAGMYITYFAKELAKMIDEGKIG